ncbi:hypothetical protein JTB14_011868, partial [Gonioctena quinquepunctata]
EKVTKALSDALSDAAELGLTVEGEEVLEEVDSDDEAEIDYHVEDEDWDMTVKNIIEHDTSDTAATLALDMDEILDMTNIERLIAEGFQWWDKE